ncbi:MetQ/NlpA family ABC transporter substrate-binding protein [Clostridium paraputrificum]|uniref:MetQ/NlpA family ABC transporter substrate-binding protein n=1 Tax=Clostridium TaxID=1485 RepID=UPI003D33F4B5
MKKTKLLTIALAGVLALGLVGCGGSKDDKTIKIGVSAVPHEEIVKAIQPLVEAEGYTLDIKVYDEYLIQDTAVNDGELDANYFQHIAFLNQANESKGYDLVNAAEIHIEPMALYSKSIKSLEDLKDGATIAIPNDPSNEARALQLLQSAGLIKVKDGDTITPIDITENKKNLKFKELDAAQLPRTLEEVDGAVINGNYALQADLDATKDGIYVEDKNDEKLKQARNILAVKKENLDSEKTKVLKKALTSDEAKKFIEEKYHGTVIAVF